MRVVRLVERACSLSLAFGRALRTMLSEGRKWVSNFRLWWIGELRRLCSWAFSSSCVRAKRGSRRRKALNARSILVLLAFGRESVAGMADLVLLVRISIYCDNVFIGAMTNRGVFSITTCRCGSGSRLSESNPKSSANACRKARWCPGIGLNRIRFSDSSAAKTRRARSWVCAHLILFEYKSSVSLLYGTCSSL